MRSPSDIAFPGPAGSIRSLELIKADELYQQALLSLEYIADQEDSDPSQTQGDAMMEISKRFLGAARAYQNCGEICSQADAMVLAVATGVAAIGIVPPQAMKMLAEARNIQHNLGQTAAVANIDMTFASLNLRDNTPQHVRDMIAFALREASEGFKKARDEGHNVLPRLFVIAETNRLAASFASRTTEEQDQYLRTALDTIRQAISLSQNNPHLFTMDIRTAKPADLINLLVYILVTKMAITKQRGESVDQEELAEVKSLLKDSLPKYHPGQAYYQQQVNNFES